MSLREKFRRRGLLLGLAAGVAVRTARAQRPGRAAVTVQPGIGFADEAVRLAIAALPKAGGADLVFTPGRYVFAAGQGTQLLFEGIESLNVEGNGAELVFAGGNTAVLFRGCAAPGIRNLIIDWSRPPFTQGVLAAVRDNGHTLDLLLPPGVQLRGNEPVGALTEVDGQSGLMRAGAADIYGGLKVTGAAKNRVTVFSAQAVASQPGATLILRDQLYGGNALHFAGCTGGLEVADVHVSAAPGMALFARYCEGDIRISRFTVGPQTGTGRLLSTNSDALHLDSCTGTATVTYSTFQAMGDDAINVHSDYLRVASLIDRRTMSVEARSALPADALPRAGALLALLSGQTLGLLGTATLASAQPGAPPRLSFDTDLPGGLAVGDVLADPSRQIDLTVSDCMFPGNRGRGVVAHGAVTVERCRFSSQSRAAVFLAPDTHWLECCEVSHAVVRDNSVADSCRSMPKSLTNPAAIQVAALIQPQGSNGPSVPALVSHDVMIAANRIFGPHESAISVGATRGVLVSDNVIHKPGAAAIRLDRVARVVLSNNTCYPASIVERHDTLFSEISSAGNIGLKVT